MGSRVAPWPLIAYPPTDLAAGHNFWQKMTTTERQKWAIVIYHEEGLSLAEVAKKAKVTKKVAKHWVSRYLSTGGVQKKRSSGRPSSMSRQAKEQAHGLLLGGEHGGAAKVAREVHMVGLTPTILHRNTVVRGAKSYGQEVGLPIRCVRGKPAKKLTQGTMKKRLEFALRNRGRNWRHVMFSDRKRFSFTNPGAKVRYVRWELEGSQGEAYTVNHSQSINLYAGMTPTGVTSVYCCAGTSKQKTIFKNKKGKAASNITSAEYKEVLQKTLLEDGQKIFTNSGLNTWVLQQDNDPSHKVAGGVIDDWDEGGRRSRAHVTLLDQWPPNSPDLNPIENLWGLVQAKVDGLGCKSFDEFKAAVIKTLRETSTTVLQALYKSMPKRIEQVIEAGGGKTKY